jgi:hypothetical protein
MPLIPIVISPRPLLQACIALASAACMQAALAQAVAPQPADAANPQAPVPSVSYRSVFKETSLGVEKDSTDWRKANDEVGRFTRGHVDILKWEEQQSNQPMTAPMDKAPANSMPDKSMDAPKPIAAPAHKH